MAIAVAILNRLFVVARKSYLYALLYLVYTIRLFGNNLGYFLHKLRIFFLNFIRNQNDKSDNFPKNLINTFLADLRFFFLTGKENLALEVTRYIPPRLACLLRDSSDVPGGNTLGLAWLRGGSTLTLLESSRRGRNFECSPYLVWARILCTRFCGCLPCCVLPTAHPNTTPLVLALCSSVGLLNFVSCFLGS